MGQGCLNGSNMSSDLHLQTALQPWSHAGYKLLDFGEPVLLCKAEMKRHVINLHKMKSPTNGLLLILPALAPILQIASVAGL